MIKQKATREMAMPTSTFAKFNEKAFYDPTIAPDKF
jgi:hypothetical protein